MTQQEPARASWDALEAPWRAAIDMAWQSYRDGGIAVGAVLTDAAGAVLGEGRNQRFAGRTRGLLAHAELGALAALPPGKDRARDSVLYTTLSPCLNTSGALLQAMERTAPRSAALARAVNRRYQESAHLPGTAAQALEDAWDLLADSTR